MSLSSSSSGAASFKSELSENTDLLTESFHPSCGKDEGKAYNENLSDDNCTSESSEKGGGDSGQNGMFTYLIILSCWLVYVFFFFLPLYQHN